MLRHRSEVWKLEIGKSTFSKECRQSVRKSLKNHAQIDKNKQYFFVIVKAILLPKNPNNYDLVWMEKFKQHAKSHDSKVLYAGVGLANAKNKNNPVYLNQDYIIEYNGIQVIDDNLN